MCASVLQDRRMQGNVPIRPPMHWVCAHAATLVRQGRGSAVERLEVAGRAAGAQARWWPRHGEHPVQECTLGEDPLR